MSGIMTFAKPVYVRAWGSCVGKKEGEGPLGACFDEVSRDTMFGQDSWEKAETTMLLRAVHAALDKAGGQWPDCMLGGDLLNQCITTNFAAREMHLPFFGLYGACSTMAESLILGAALVSGGFMDRALCTASSHFCSAERQYRFPLGYGGQRTQTAQWTATAEGAVLFSTDDGQKIRVTRACPGRVYDPGITDVNNMVAAMAQSAYESLRQFFAETGERPENYDLIVTGDLASIGKGIVLELFRRDGVDLRRVYEDCGLLLFSTDQDVHAGGSGCGCSAAVLCGKILGELARGALRRVLFCGTGALLSPVSSNQGENIPGICHVVELEAKA